MKHKTIKIIISIIIIILSYGFIIYRVMMFEELPELLSLAVSYSINDLLLLSLVIVLMILNWSIETIKWRMLISDVQYFSFYEALKIIFAGISIGIFTPNRLGEIGGRVLFLEKGKRTFGILATGIGSYAQFTTSIITGVLGFVLLLKLFPDKIMTQPLFNNISALILVAVSVFLIWIYFNIKNIKSLVLKISFFRKRINQLEYLSKMDKTYLLKVLSFSMLRYVIFGIQFYILLYSFDIKLTVFQAYISISLIYLFATLIPTTTLAELGIKGSLAIFFIGLFSGNILGIVISTFILWIINLAIPAIIGSIYLIKKRFLI